MHFERVRPMTGLSTYVEWFWGMKSDQREPEQQKIVPDGFPEIIVHFGDPYKIHLHGRWHRQARTLLGGQLKRHFLLENTGTTDIFGITFRPAALTHLFDLDMNDYADRVVPLRKVPGPWTTFTNQLATCAGFDDRVMAAEEFLKAHTPDATTNAIDRCLDILFRDHGTASMEQVCREAGVSERQLQRFCLRYIGLSPKFYARIIRFSHLLQLIKEGKTLWSDVLHISGYYDQSHFIRDFKAFTGEDPTRFRYRDKSMTTFFARKSGGKMSGLSNRKPG
jgi:AraC-like DNA-binding protein